MTTATRDTAGAAQLDALAQRLIAAGATRTPIAPIRSALAVADVDTAYAIADRVTQARLAEGWRLAGRKIGLTAKSVQRQLGVDQPDFGMLFDRMAVPDGESVSIDTLIAPKCEAEVAFVLGDDLDIACPTTVDALGAIDYALPAIEIVDSRIANWDIGIVDTIADNASSALYVVGNTPVPLDAVDLRLCGMILQKNGVGVSYGAGAACLGSPLTAFVWLAAKLAAVGRPLRAGDVVLSGALGPMVPAAGGDAFEARIGGLGSVRVHFSSSRNGATPA
jgi:2-keto-4-pentenoate hydratase